MDVQTENTDPPSCESQPSGKIRKGFKLFGKRKPGNIFSIRGKGDGNNKSSVSKTKQPDGLSETTAPNPEQEPDKENGQEGSQGEMEHGEEESLGEDGVLAAAHENASSISSASSARSLGFLSLLKGGRKGGDRQVQTMSHPAGRKRRGLKGLFNNVVFRSKDKEDQDECPPSPLLMSSRTNSVEIIKEDLALTPRSMPRSLDSPTTESCEPIKSFTTPDSAATTPSEITSPQVTTGNVSTTDKHVPPLPTSGSPLVPGDNSLSSLLADISSLLTFDSITGGGDIMADVEAEWGKASSVVVSEVTPSPTCFSSPATSFVAATFVSTAKPSPASVSTTPPSKSSPLFSKTLSSSPPTAEPISIVTTLTKTSTFTTHSVNRSSDATSSVFSTSMMKSAPIFTAGKPSTTPQNTSSLSPAKISPPLMTFRCMTSSASVVATTSSSTSATASKPPSVNSVLTSTVRKLDSDISAPPQMFPSISQPIFVPTSPLTLDKTLPVPHTPPIPFTQSPPAKFDCANGSNRQATSSSGPASKAPVPVSHTKPSSPVPVVPFTTTTVPLSAAASVLVSVSLPKPTFTSSQVEASQPALPNHSSSSTLTATAKTELSPTSSTSSDKTPATTKPTPSRDKMPAAPETPPAPTTLAPPSPPVPAQITISVPKNTPAPDHSQVAPSKALSAPSAPPQIPVSSSSDSFAPVYFPTLVSKESPISAQIPASQAKAPHTPTPAPCPVKLLPSPPEPWTRETPEAAKVIGSRQVSVDGQLVSPSSTIAPGAQAVAPKTVELHESRMSLQGPSREKRTPYVKTSGLSKIPVVGGGRAGKIPVRENHHADDDARRDPPTPVQEEERAHLNSHDGLSRDKVSDVQASVSKCVQEESQQPPKVLTSLPRDSKIPVKHGAQSHAAVQSPHEPPRTKIPVSKVPVRRVGKPTAAGGSTQIKK